MNRDINQSKKLVLWKIPKINWKALERKKERKKFKRNLI